MSKTPHCVEVLEGGVRSRAVITDKSLQDCRHSTKTTCHRCCPVCTNGDQLCKLDVVFQKFVENKLCDAIAWLVGAHFEKDRNLFDVVVKRKPRETRQEMLVSNKGGIKSDRKEWTLLEVPLTRLYLILIVSQRLSDTRIKTCMNSFCDSFTLGEDEDHHCLPEM